MACALCFGLVVESLTGLAGGYRQPLLAAYLAAGALFTYKYFTRVKTVAIYKYQSIFKGEGGYLQKQEQLIAQNEDEVILQFFKSKFPHVKFSYQLLTLDTDAEEKASSVLSSLRELLGLIFRNFLSMLGCTRPGGQKEVESPSQVKYIEASIWSRNEILETYFLFINPVNVLLLSSASLEAWTNYCVLFIVFLVLNKLVEVFDGVDPSDRLF